MHDDDPDAMEAILRHLYGFDNDSVLEARGHTGGLVAQATYVLQVIITADKYGVDRDFIDAAEGRLFDRLSCEMEDPREILSVLKMCTVDSEIHPLLVSTVENILRIHMTDLAEVPEWFDWIHFVPAVNKKISKEAAQMKDLKHEGHTRCCGECGEMVPYLVNGGLCSCGPEGPWILYSIIH